MHGPIAKYLLVIKSMNFSVKIYLTSVDKIENGKTTTLKSFDVNRIKVSVDRIEHFDDDYYLKHYPEFFKLKVVLV